LSNEKVSDAKDPSLASIKSAKPQSSFEQRINTYWLLFLLSIIWGIAFVAVRRADFELSPVNLALLRWLISSVAYGIVLLFLGRPKTPFERKDLPRLLVISFANVPMYHLALNYAETSVSSGLAGLLISLGPVFITALSAYSLKEKVTWNIALALVMAVSGAAILAIGNFSGSSSGLIGPAEVVVSALAYAIFSVLSKPLVRKYGALHVAIWAGLTGTVMLLPLVSESLIKQTEALSLYGWISVLYLALLSTVLGYSMFYTLVSRGAVSRLSIQLYLIPIVSVIGGILFLQESLTIASIVGGGVMLVAIALATKTKS
jgi:drug/metabolite transporter (DMT)-like permease